MGYRRITIVLFLLLQGCRGAAERPAPSAMTPPPAAPSRTWVHPEEIAGKTIAEIEAMNISCLCIIRPDKRHESMRLLFEIYEKNEGKPYLSEMVANWLKVKPLLPTFQTHETYKGRDYKQVFLRYCEDGWQYGDLNADGRVDYEDFAIYAGSPKMGK